MANVTLRELFCSTLRDHFQDDISEGKTTEGAINTIAKKYYNELTTMEGWKEALISASLDIRQHIIKTGTYPPIQ